MFFSQCIKETNGLMDKGNPVVDKGRPEMYTHAYSTLEVFRLDILGTLDCYTAPYPMNQLSDFIG